LKFLRNFNAQILVVFDAKNIIIFNALFAVEFGVELQAVFHLADLAGTAQGEVPVLASLAVLLARVLIKVVLHALVDRALHALAQQKDVPGLALYALVGVLVLYLLHRLAVLIILLREAVPVGGYDELEFADLALQRRRQGVGDVVVFAVRYEVRLGGDLDVLHVERLRADELVVYVGGVYL
jgi:hypothetical protein